jgi:hypothetical protein
VLVTGIYLADRENLVSQIILELGKSANWKVEQKWISLGKKQPDPHLIPFTMQVTASPLPKFVLLNQLLSKIDLQEFEFLIITDDDIRLPVNFLDSYLALVSRHNFALAQPARTHDSYIDHQFVEQLDGINARRTRFVEIGPLFSFHRTAFAHFLPFDETSPMGWGLDFVWPVLAEKHDLNIGIVDATPVVHNLRKPVAYYNYSDANDAMIEYLAHQSYLSKKDAFFILESYA